MSGTWWKGLTQTQEAYIGLLQEVQLGPKSSWPITRSHQRASADLRWSNTPRDKDVKTARKASDPLTSPMIRKQWVGNALSDLYFWQLASPTSRGYVVIWWQTNKSSVHDLKLLSSRTAGRLFLVWVWGTFTSRREWGTKNKCMKIMITTKHI